MLITFVTSMWGTKTSAQIWVLRERNGIYSEKEIPGKLTLKLRWERVVARPSVGRKGIPGRGKALYEESEAREGLGMWAQGRWVRGVQSELGKRHRAGSGRPDLVELLSEVCCLSRHATLLGHWAGSDMFLVPYSPWCGQDRCVPFTLDVRKWKGIKLSKIYCHVVWTLKCLPQRLQF